MLPANTAACGSHRGELPIHREHDSNLTHTGEHTSVKYMILSKVFDATGHYLASKLFKGLNILSQLSIYKIWIISKKSSGSFPENLVRMKVNFMAPFYGWGSTVARLPNHYEEKIYF